MYGLTMIDFADLTLADGRRADGVNVHELGRALKKAGVPGVSASDGRQTLLEKYREHQEAQSLAASKAKDEARARFVR